MKLFSRYNRINLLFTIAIFVTGSVVLSFLIRYLVNNQTDNDLIIEKDEITTYVSQFKSLPRIQDVEGEYTTYKLLHSIPNQRVRFYTQKRWNEEEHDGEFVRSIEWGMKVSNQYYLITISKSLDVTEDLIQSIIIITVILILLILIAGLLINRVLLRRLWQPFYQSIESVQQFQLNNMNQISLGKSNIDEFNLMNATLENALNKAQNDYHTLKVFTENASHELQTPLAIISSKLDVLIQSEDLTKSQSEAISSAYKALGNLKRLNHSLLLLAKIENGQFTEQTTIDLQQLIREKQKQFAEQLQSKRIETRLNVTASVISGNAQLADILLNNLFSNAIRYNIESGTIVCELKANQLAISNTSKLPALEERYLFNRFYKGNPGTAQHGLGLSIVKEICEASGYTCRYEFQLPDTHSFIITW